MGKAPAFKKVFGGISLTCFNSGEMVYLCVSFQLCQRFCGCAHEVVGHSVDINAVVVNNVTFLYSKTSALLVVFMLSAFNVKRLEIIGLK